MLKIKDIQNHKGFNSSILNTKGFHPLISRKFKCFHLHILLFDHKAHIMLDFLGVELKMLESMHLPL